MSKLPACEVQALPFQAARPQWHNSSTVNKLTRRTQIWAIELRDSPDYLKVLESWLSSKELKRSARLVIVKKRNHQIQSKAWLRWLLAQYTGVPPQQVRYRHGPLGKPYIDSDTAKIQFNATDSGNTLLIAFHESNELGLDIEAFPRKVNYLGIAKKKLTKEEFQLLSSLQEHNQSNAFLALWTRKEAYGKAIGLGIRYPMNKIQLCENFDQQTYRIDDGGENIWHLLQIADPQFIACLVSSHAFSEIDFYKLDINSLKLNHG